jgi:hypothetical protein
VLEEVPEVKYSLSYQAILRGTPGTVHVNEDGVEFVYFNHGRKAFEIVKINPAHTHMIIPTKKRAPIPPQRSNPTPPQR